jgi:membrane-associated phospholipid phosphatase
VFSLGPRILVTVCWVGGIAILALGAWLVCYAPNCAVTSLDATLLDWFAQRRNETFDSVFRAATWLGSIAVLGPAVAASMSLLAYRRRMREGLFLGLALVGTMVIVHVSKLVAARPRPAGINAVITMPLDLSFPSAHSAQIVAVVFASLIVVSRLKVESLKWLIPIGALCILLVATSRIYLQVHYPSDVLAGALAAGLWVFGLAKLTFLRGSR